MYSFNQNTMPYSATSLMSAYASMATSILLVRSLANELIPSPLRTRIFTSLRFFFKSKTPNLTLLIEELAGIGRNQIYDASETYLRTKISPDADKLKISKTPKDKNLTIKLENDERVLDHFEGIELKWKFVCSESESKDPRNLQNFRYEKRWFELSFHKKHKEKVLDSYIPYVLEIAKAIQNELRVLKMFTLNNAMVNYGGMKWDSIKFEHPATFETLAMEPEAKNAIMEDLNMFLNRKEFYKRVGKAWKRGYLLYGPPGTGKSSLVAAMANYLRFDVYDLQLANIISDSDLRRLLLATGNKSILVIEDIDCSLELPDRRVGVTDGTKKQDLQLTLSGLLNFIDGLWSSCGDERIIIFTTNNKDRLDPALLRPGRMDMHINMSYCKPGGFRTLASNYLGIISGNNQSLVSEIEGLMDIVEVTPAQVAEELMRSEKVEVALEGLVKLLKRKQLEETDRGDESKSEAQMHKKQKVESNVYL